MVHYAWSLTQSTSIETICLGSKCGQHGKKRNYLNINFSFHSLLKTCFFHLFYIILFKFHYKVAIGGLLYELILLFSLMTIYN